MVDTTTTFKLKRDTAANWASNNPTLSLGEPGIETDTGIIKIGDGATSYNSLSARVPTTQKSTRSATVIIAASDCSVKGIEQADYVCDGIDDQVEIQAAINALPLSGGRVILLDGTFNLSGNINPISNSTIEGQGFSTILKITNSTYKNVIELYNLNNVLITNLQIDGNKTNNVYQSDENTQNGVFINESYYCCVENILINNCASSGIRIKVLDGVTTPKLLHNILSNITSINNRYGISFGEWAEYMIVGNCTFSNNSIYGVKISTSNLSFCNCMMLQNSGDGVKMEQSDKTSNNTFDCCQINHNGQCGFRLSTAWNTNINACKIIANGRHGVWCEGTIDTSITNCSVHQNSIGNTNIYDEICMAGSAMHTIITNNNIQLIAGGARYGIYETSGCTYSIITGNYIGEHNTGTIYRTAANSICFRNIGYVSDKNGTAAIPTGQTSISVSHGLAAAPTRVQLTPTTATGGKQYYVSEKAASTFTISIDSAHTSNISFDWQAIV